MVINSKNKGSNYERKVAELLTAKIKNSQFKRVPGSGMLGTSLSESLLQGDIKGEIENFPMKIRGECKTGYSNKKDSAAKSITIKKEWFDKIREEAKSSYSFPIFIGHFDNAREGTKDFVALDINDFAQLMNMYTDLKRELELAYETKRVV